jgi:hypothetical protein
MEFCFADRIEDVLRIAVPGLRERLEERTDASIVSAA